jgi:hypothetical protein
MRRERKKTFHSLNNYDVRTSTQNRSIFMFSKRVKKFWSIKKKMFLSQRSKVLFWIELLNIVRLLLLLSGMSGNIDLDTFWWNTCRTTWPGRSTWNRRCSWILEKKVPELLTPLKLEKILFEVVVMKAGKNLT